MSERTQESPSGLSWVVLTQGQRPAQLRAAIDSIRRGGDLVDIVVWNNGDAEAVVPPEVRWIVSATNLGIPGGRDAALGRTETPLVGFLDDDAKILTPDVGELITQAFERDSRLGALTFRIVDESGSTARRHVPRVGDGSAERPGPSATFLGGACAIRRAAYDAAGGYWPELFYAHEELDLAWRMQDVGFRIEYRPDIVVAHPKTSISRHENGWRLTGRNRVMIARRNLPLPVCVVHVLAWLGAGLLRAPNSTCRRAYLSGWWEGWSMGVERRPISWNTVLAVSRAGRPPLI